ncbi:pleckstrin homology domain-containing family O member 2 [Discoglossus pictus]
MEDGVKGSSDAPPGSQVVYKAGWLKKNSGGLLGLWKDRYIFLHKTNLLVCESEDEQKCIETLELSSYDRCQDQKTFLKRKKHFTLVPSPGSKVQDVKLQAKNVEERNEWIQALNEGINRGKNKVFDEVKVDESCTLEHVTRDRAKKGAAKRRPPTRIHMREVAEAVSDGSSRLELDTLDSGAPRGVTPIPEDPEPQPPKQPVKIPMPPSKTTSTIKELNPDTTNNNDEMHHPPSPPPKVLKENVYVREKLLSEEGQESIDKPEPDTGSRENLGEIANSPPKPPPKILSHKMKILWVGSSSDVLDKEDIESAETESKENLSSNSLEVESQGGSDHQGEQKLDDEESESEPFTKIDAKETSDQEENEDNKIMKSVEDEEENTEEQGNTPKPEKEKPKVLRTLTPITYTAVEMDISARKPRSSSMGDLLSEDSENNTDRKSSLLHLNKDHLRQVEVKLARGREKTETLLNRVLQGELVKSIEGNGPDINAETLLNEAVTQLREASEALQEIKESNTLKDVSDAEKEKQKQLLTLYRRSLP